MPPQLFSAPDFLELGLELCGFSQKTINKNSATTKHIRFRDKFYALPNMCALLYIDIQSDDLGLDQIINPTPEYLLLALFFLKKYPTKHDMAGFIDSCEETALKKSKEYVGAIQALSKKKINWIFDDEDAHKEKFMVSVDGVHCRINEPRIEPSTKWHSHKFNKAALSYEVAIAVYHDQIVWINGPFPASTNDLTIFKSENGLIEKIPDGKLVVADEAYRSLDMCSTRNAFDKESVKAFKKRVKARHESCYSRFKAFGVLVQPFRGTGDIETRKKKHKHVFVACAVIIQYEMDMNRPIFKV